MSEFLSIKTSIIHWACERVNVLYTELSSKKGLSSLKNEKNGIVKLTMRQLNKLASILRYPLVYFMLDEPVTDIDKLDIEDFRTSKNQKIKPSINLCEQIDYCKNQQAWFSDYAKINDFVPFKYINHFKLDDCPELSGKVVGDYLHITHSLCKDEGEFLQKIKNILEKNIILVISSKVLKHTNYRLNTTEFRGFALTDSYAPLIFINGNDSVRAQIFTICHELGHICLGLSGVSDVSIHNTKNTETWCNDFAANILMPHDEIISDFEESLDLQDFIKTASKKYHVSNIALIIRIYKLHLIDKEKFSIELDKAEHQYLDYSKNVEKKKSGGDYYNNVGSRLSNLLTKALIASTAVGETTFRDATYLLGLKSISVFEQLSKKLNEGK